MSHKLTLDVPDEVYTPLAESAARDGAKLEDVALAWLAAQARGAHDPVEDVIGSFRSNVPNWADRHDEIIGEALKRELRGESGTGG